MSQTQVFRKGSVLAVSVALVGLLILGGGQPASAQGPRRPSINAQAFNACTTTNYADLVAKALGTTVVDIRKAIVNGQTLQDIATASNGNLQAAIDAYQTARKADIDQAVKDGVVTQDEATAMEAAPATPGAPATPNVNGPTTPRAPGPGGAFAAPFPDVSNFRMLLQLGGPSTPAAPGGFAGGFGGGIGLGINAGAFNLVKQYVVAGQALNIKCADLVKMLITPPGQSIATLAAAQKIDTKTVNDALTSAYKTALAQDVTDGVITQAQADQLSPLIDTAAATFVSNPLPMGPQATPAR